MQMLSSEMEAVTTDTPEDRSVKERNYVRAAGLELNAQRYAISTDTWSKIYVHRIDHSGGT
jgi:hypothetical protein